jgi:hypothetical protein
MKLAIILALSITYSWAKSGGVGNGGDAIVCPDKVMLLDSYEAQKMRLKIDLSDENVSNPTWRSMVNVAVKRLQRFDEETATKLYDYSMEMVNDFEKFEMYPQARGKHVYIGYDVIAEINDSEHVSTPEGCEEFPRQLVSQRVPKFKHEFRYEFSQSLWERMSLVDQAMTILHEAWYRIMLENGAENSRAARYMNALVASTVFEDYTFQDYFEEIKETEIKFYEIRNQSTAIKDQKIKINIKEHTVNFVDGVACAPNFILNPNIKETYTLLNRAQRYFLKTKFQNVCFKNSRLTKVVLPTRIPNSKATLRLPFHQVQFEKALTSEPALVFNEFGKLSHLENMSYKSAMEMYYVCDGKRSYTQRFGCEKGPFINHDSKISNPQTIEFDDKEELVLFK